MSAVLSWLLDSLVTLAQLLSAAVAVTVTALAAAWLVGAVVNRTVPRGPVDTWGVLDREHIEHIRSLRAITDDEGEAREAVR